MNAKLNANLFWTAVYNNSTLLLKWGSDLVASLMLLFIGFAAVYNKESITAIYAGMFCVYNLRLLIVIYKYDCINYIFFVIFMIFTGLVIVNIIGTASILPDFFSYKNNVRSKFDAVLRICGFINVSKIEQF